MPDTVRLLQDYGLFDGESHFIRIASDDYTMWADGEPVEEPEVQAVLEELFRQAHASGHVFKHGYDYCFRVLGPRVPEPT